MTDTARRIKAVPKPDDQPPALADLTKKADLTKPVAMCTLGDLEPLVHHSVANVLTDYLDGRIERPPSEWMTKTECGQYLRVCSAKVDAFSRREVDPLQFSMVGDHRRYLRADTRAWVQRQRGVT